MRVYVVRHGESETNRAKKWTGWLDAHLTDKGKEDAKKAGEFLKGVAFDAIYSSTLIRARETAEAAIPSCRYETSELLREINVGTLVGKPISVVSEAEQSKLKELGYSAYDGESKKEFSDRVLGFMNMLCTLSYDNVAVFTHAGWMGEMLDSVLGVSIPTSRICCNNCTVAVFEYTNGKWKLHSWVNML